MSRFDDGLDEIIKTMTDYLENNSSLEVIRGSSYALAVVVRTKEEAGQVALYLRSGGDKIKLRKRAITVWEVWGKVSSSAELAKRALGPAAYIGRGKKR